MSRTAIFSLSLLIMLSATSGCSLKLQPHPDPFLEALVASQPDHPAGLFSLGLEAQNAGRYDKASHYYERLLTIEPEHRMALNRLGECHMESRQYRQAEAAYRKSLEIGENLIARAGLTMALLMDGDLEEARLSLTRLADYGSPAIVFLIEGNLALVEQRHEDAVRLYENSLNLEPNQPDLRKRLGILREYLTLTR